MIAYEPLFFLPLKGVGIFTHRPYGQETSIATSQYESMIPFHIFSLELLGFLTNEVRKKTQQIKIRHL